MGKTTPLSAGRLWWRSLDQHVPKELRLLDDRPAEHLSGAGLSERNGHLAIRQLATMTEPNGAFSIRDLSWAPLRTPKLQNVVAQKGPLHPDEIP